MIIYFLRRCNSYIFFDIAYHFNPPKKKKTYQFGYQQNVPLFHTQNNNNNYRKYLFFFFQKSNNNKKEITINNKRVRP